MCAGESRVDLSIKHPAVLLAGTGIERYREGLQSEQEVLSYLADVMIEAYATESGVLRAWRAFETGLSDAALHRQAASTYVYEALGRVELAARSALAAMFEGEDLDRQLASLRNLLQATPANTVMMRRMLADATVANGGYLFM